MPISLESGRGSWKKSIVVVLSESVSLCSYRIYFPETSVLFGSHPVALKGYPRFCAQKSLLAVRGTIWDVGIKPPSVLLIACSLIAC